MKSLQESELLASISSTRSIFDHAVLTSDAGWSILFSADVDESAVETPDGGGYLFSLIRAAEIWSEKDSRQLTLPLNTVHLFAKSYLVKHFLTTQNPVMLAERRRQYFPFAVKFVSING